MSNLFESLRVQTLYDFMSHLSEAYRAQITLTVSFGISNDYSQFYLILLANGWEKGEEMSF